MEPSRPVKLSQFDQFVDISSTKTRIKKVLSVQVPVIVHAEVDKLKPLIAKVRKNEAERDIKDILVKSDFPNSEQIQIVENMIRILIKDIFRLTLKHFDYQIACEKLEEMSVFHKNLEKVDRLSRKVASLIDEKLQPLQNQLKARLPSSPEAQEWFSNLQAERNVILLQLELNLNFFRDERKLVDVLKQLNERIKEDKYRTAEHSRYIVPSYVKDENKEPSPLDMSYIDAFLKGDKKVLLISGEVGSGKSMFAERVESYLLEQYLDQDGEYIPIVIDMTDITRGLKKARFPEEVIPTLKERKVLFILDGVNEPQFKRKPLGGLLSEWPNAKIMFGDRLGGVLQRNDLFFYPYVNGESDSTSFQKAVICSFAPQQIEEYLEKYSKDSPITLDFPNLAKRPFALRELVKMSTLSKNDIHRKFVQRYLQRELHKFVGHSLPDRFNYESEKNIIRMMWGYSMALARQMTEDHLTSVSENDARYTKFFGSSEKVQFYMKLSPIIRTGDVYTFLCPELLNFFATYSFKNNE